MGQQQTVEWQDDGYTLMRGAREFGPWHVAQVGTLGEHGVTVGAPEFYGASDTGADVCVVGLEAAREFAAQLLAAIEYAERCLVR